MAGAFLIRRSWRRFRRLFDDLALCPLLDYRAYRQTEGKVYRFTGRLESVTGDRTLWIRGDKLTVPVALAGAETYVLPMQEGGGQGAIFDPGEEAPERIRWDRVSTLTDEAKVFVGGTLEMRDDCRIFAASPGKPLLLIFYDGPDRSLAVRAIRAGRHRNEYWNPITPYALVLGALFLIFLALSFLPRPAFHVTALVAFAAVFIPLFPMGPPGVLFTVAYRRLWLQARIFRAYRDLARLPLIYLEGGTGKSCLPGNEQYGAVSLDDLPGEAEGGNIPLLIPEEEKRKKDRWFVYGALPEPGGRPFEPADVFAVYGALPGEPEALARRYIRKACVFEIAAWLLLLTGIGLNALFVRVIIALL
ncbi:MAG: hypothetical protein LBH26_06370 [Treponema sp.]|jgi:hypothetical protein|nr:hypothetical protein [Treponema sp.]